MKFRPINSLQLRCWPRELAVVVWLSVIPVATPAETAAEANLIAQNCFGCHGPEGNSSGPLTPSISGFSREYLVNALLAYKYGDDRTALAIARVQIGLSHGDFPARRRPATIMDRIARGYTDAQLLASADYFADQPRLAVAQRVDEGLIANGQRVDAEHCADCHAPDRQASVGAGALSGQLIGYLRVTLEDFATGRREMPADMRTSLQALDGESLEALVHYYAGPK